MNCNHNYDCCWHTFTAECHPCLCLCSFCVYYWTYSSAAALPQRFRGVVPLMSSFSRLIDTIVRSVKYILRLTCANIHPTFQGVDAFCGWRMWVSMYLCTKVYALCCKGVHVFWGHVATCYSTPSCQILGMKCLRYVPRKGSKLATHYRVIHCYLSIGILFHNPPAKSKLKFSF